MSNSWGKNNNNVLLYHSDFFQYSRRLVYGPNKIVVKELSICTLLCLEVLNPFYIFQILSFILWFADDYYYYAATIMLMAMGGIGMSVMQTRKVSIFACKTSQFQWRLLLEPKKLEVYLPQQRCVHCSEAYAKKQHGRGRYGVQERDYIDRVLGTGRYIGNTLPRVRYVLRRVVTHGELYP